MDRCFIPRMNFGKFMIGERLTVAEEAGSREASKYLG